MSALLKGARTIALVGNGPVSTVAAGAIDDADIVVRMNHAALCGAAGRRTDVLAVNSNIWTSGFARTGRPVNPLAFRTAREFWLAREADGETEHDGRPLVFLGDETVARLRLDLQRFVADENEIAPSVGARVLRHVLDNSDADVVLYGFTHQGDLKHSWSAEAGWMAELAAAGRLRYGSRDGNPVRQAPLMTVRMQAQRIANHIRSGRF